MRRPWPTGGGGGAVATNKKNVNLMSVGLNSLHT